MKRFYWDFFGPRAEGTAHHFHRHLGEFLTKHHLTCDTGVEIVVKDKHYAVWCQTPEESYAVIETALRPKRSGPLTEELK